MTFHETPPKKQDELELGPTGTDALEYRIDKLLRENQALALLVVDLLNVEKVARDTVREFELLGFDKGNRTLHTMKKLRESFAFTTRDRRVILRSSILFAMGPDPHGGLDPHPDTVDAITDGVLARIAVNNARPAKYKNESWREQTQEYHAEHADSHITRAWLSIHDEPGYTWLSDLGQPEVAHAGLRIDFLLHLHAKNNAGSDRK